MADDIQKNQTDETADVTSVEQDLKAQCEEYLSGWKRAQADYANLKRETEKDKIEFVKFANNDLLLRLLPAADSLEAAVSSLPESTDKDWARGLQAAYAQFTSFLRDAGLERIDCAGQMDPKIHEAVAQEESDLPAGEITQVVRAGWTLGGRVLRAARVIVAKSKPDES